MLIVILLIFATVVYYFGINRILGLPPGPPPLPLLGNLLSFQSNLDEVLLKWKAQYGRIFTVWLPNPMVVIGDHKVLQEHVVKQANTFLYKRNPEELMKIWLGGNFGIGFQDDHMVKEQRKFALRTLQELAFRSTALEESVHASAMEVVDRWGKSEGKAVDVTENIEKAVGQIIWKLTFGINLEFDNNTVPYVRKLQEKFFLLMSGPLMMLLEMIPSIKKLDFLFNRRFSRLQAKFEENNRVIRKAIDTAIENFQPEDHPTCYVDSFLQEMHNNAEAGKPMGNYHMRQLQGSAVNVWGAAFETTVSFIRLCCLEMVNHPDAQRKLQKEIDDAVGKRRIVYDDKKLMPYTMAFLQEVYRLVNVLPLNFQRRIEEVTKIEGISIPAGTTILPQFSMVHMDPKEFDRPDYFCPERHLDSEGQFVKDARINPFSLGARDCLGKMLAQMETFVMFTTFVQHCHFTPVNKVPPPAVFLHGFTRSVDRFELKVEPRN